MSVEALLLPTSEAARVVARSAYRSPRGRESNESWLDRLTRLVASAELFGSVEIVVTGVGAVRYGARADNGDDSVDEASATASAGDRSASVTLRAPLSEPAMGRTQQEWVAALLATTAVALVDRTRSTARLAVLEGVARKAAHAVDRAVVVQDVSGGEVACRTPRAAAPGVSRLGSFASDHWGRTWPICSDHQRVGRLWLGAGPELSEDELVTVAAVTAVIGAVLAL